MSRERKFLSPVSQAVVRLVHAGGVMTLNELLTAYRDQTLAPEALRRRLHDLVLAGWLDKAHRPRPDRANGVAWMVTEEALPHLWSTDPLPMRPSPLPRRRQENATAPRRAPAAPCIATAAREVPICNASSRAAYVPPPGPPMRPGALDFLKYPSHGACR